MEFRDAVPYVVGAYMGIWAVLFAYVFILNKKLSDLTRELGAMSKVLEKKAK